METEILRELVFKRETIAFLSSQEQSHVYGATGDGCDTCSCAGNGCPRGSANDPGTGDSYNNAICKTKDNTCPDSCNGNCGSGSCNDSCVDTCAICFSDACVMSKHMVCPPSEGPTCK